MSDRAGARHPERTCIGCRTKRGTLGLVRVAHRPDGVLAPGRGESGRGAWLCAGSNSCFESAFRRRAFGRALRREIPTQELAALRETLLSEAPSTSNGAGGLKSEGVGGE